MEIYKRNGTQKKEFFSRLKGSQKSIDLIDKKLRSCWNTFGECDFILSVDKTGDHSDERWLFHFRESDFRKKEITERGRLEAWARLKPKYGKKVVDALRLI